MRNIHKLQLKQNKFNEVISNTSHFLVLEKETVNQGDYVLCWVASEDETLNDSLLVEIADLIFDENVKDGFIIAKIKKI